MSEHLDALNAVSRDRDGVPRCSDRKLTAAQGAGLIEFSAWPAGVWKITPAGRDYLEVESAREEIDENGEDFGL